VKIIVDFDKFKKYLDKTDRISVLENFESKEDGFFCINEDELLNDHIIVV
jgi:hypothetical protein